MVKAKRILCMLLVLCMLAVTLPSAVFATNADAAVVALQAENTATEETTETEETEGENFVAELAADLTFSGSGTEADPYIIEDADDMIELANAANAGDTFSGVHFKLSDSAENITLSTDTGFTPIGNNTYPFCGTFDGNNKTITLDITVNEAYGKAGLFGEIGNGAVVKNVKTAGTVTSDGSASCAGGIVGYTINSSNGVIIIYNCHNGANVTSDYYAGGIVGQASGTYIYNCTNSGTVSGVDRIGGICGHFSYSTMINCMNTGEVTYSETVGNIGGIIGYGWGITLQNNVNLGAVKDDYGIAQYVRYLDSSSTNNYYTNEKGIGTSEDEFGTNVKIKQATEDELKTALGLSLLNKFINENPIDGYTLQYWTTDGESISFTDTKQPMAYLITNNSSGALSCSEYALNGDTVTITPIDNGYETIESVTVEDSNGNEVSVTKQNDGTYTFAMPESDVAVSATTKIKLSKDEDGIYLINNAEDMIIFSKAVNSGSYTGNNLNARLTAEEEISLSTADGFKPIGTENGSYTGTFDGNGKTIELNLTNTINNDIGLFGYLGGTVKNLTVKGSVTGHARVGSIAGSNDGTIENCTSYVTIEASSMYVGGIAGRNSGKLINCINYGAVEGSGNVGGIVGTVDSHGKVYNCINYGDVKGESDTGGISGHFWSDYAKNCVNYGAVSKAEGSEYEVGGVMGFANMAESNTYYENCFFLSDDTTNTGLDFAAIYENGDAPTDSGARTAEELVSEDVLIKLNMLSDLNSDYLYWEVKDNKLSLTSTRPDMPYEIVNNSEYLTVAESADAGEIVVIGTENIPSYLKLEEITVNGEKLSADGNGAYSFTMPEKTVTVEAEFDLKLEKKSDYYLISSDEDLNIFAQAVNDGGYCNIDVKLTADVTASTEKGFEPIGNDENRYYGEFEGDGHTITLAITEGVMLGECEATALFSKMGSGTVKNLMLKGSVVGSDDANSYTAALMAYNSHSDFTNIYNVYSEADVKGGGYVGGIIGVGECRYVIGNVVNNGKVESTGTSESAKKVGAISGAYTPDNSSNVYYNSEKNSGVVDVAYNDFEAEANTENSISGSAKTAAELFSDNTVDSLNSYSHDNDDLLYWNVLKAEGVADTFTFSKKSATPLYEIYENSEYVSVDIEYAREGKTVTVTVSAPEDDPYISAITGINVVDYDENKISVTSTATDTYTFVMPATNVSITPVCEVVGIEKDENGVYLIADAEDLYIFSLLTSMGGSDADARVTAEALDLTSFEQDIMPIGYNDSYTGTFDGNGVEITAYNYIFYYTNGAEIKNINTTIQNEDDYDLAGIVYSAYKTKIDNCTVNMMVKSGYAAGIVSYAEDCVITNCSVDIQANTYYAGGIVYESYGDTVIANCIFASMNYLVAEEFGGIVYCAYDNTEIYNCVSFGYLLAYEAGAIVYDSESSIKTENNFCFVMNAYTKERCYDITYVDGREMYSYTDKNSAMTEDDMMYRSVQLKLNDYIKNNPNIADGTTLREWSVAYGYLPCFVDEEMGVTPLYRINNVGIELDIPYAALEGEEIKFVVSSEAEFTITDAGGTEVEYATEQDDGYTMVTVTMPAKEITINVTLDTGLTNTKEIDGKTYVVIKTADEFIKAIKAIENGNTGLNVFIENDITLSSEAGSNYPAHSEVYLYNGIFDGNGKTVTFGNIGYDDTTYTAMLGVIGKNGIVKDLNVDGEIHGENAAGIALYNEGTIYNCINKADITATNGNAGGIVFNNNGAIFNCMNKGAVTGVTEAGAVCADNEGSVFLNVNSGTVTITTPAEDAEAYDEFIYTDDGNTYKNVTVTSDFDDAAADMNYNLEETKISADVYGDSHFDYMGISAEILADANEWSATDTEVVFADDVNKAYYLVYGAVYNDDEATLVYKAGDTVEITVDKEAFDEGTEVWGINVFDMNNNKLAVSAVDGKADTYSFTMPANAVEVRYSIADASLESETGTDGNKYYLVGSLEELETAVDIINYSDDAANIKLTADITEEYTGDSIREYNGIFDGNGHSIKLGVEKYDNYEYYGFFGKLEEYAVVKNLTLNGYIKTDADYAGAFAGKNGGIIYNCTNNADIYNSNGYAGGIAGINIAEPYVPAVGMAADYEEEITGKGLIKNCTNNGDVYGCDSAGGIACVSANDTVYNLTEEDTATIIGCTNNGAVESPDSVGGIVRRAEGLNDNITIIKDCINNGELDGYEEVGGIVSDSTYTYIENCINNADIEIVDEDADNIGGIVGDANNGTTVINCENNGEVTAPEDVGGIVGDAYRADIINCINRGAISGDTKYIGGIAGYIDGNTIISNCFSCGIIQSEEGYTIANVDDDPKSVLIENTYYLQTESINAGIPSSDTSAENDKSTAVTSEQIASGEVSYNLTKTADDRMKKWSYDENGVIFADEDNGAVYMVTIADGIQNGTVAVANKYAKADSNVTLTATPNEGYVLDGFIGVEVDENDSFTMPSEDIEISAEFIPAFEGTEKSDIINLVRGKAMESVNLADYVKFIDESVTNGFTFTLAEGSTLPEGLTLDGGIVSGTPTKSGNFLVVFDVADNGATLAGLDPEIATLSAKLTLTFAVAEPTYTITIADSENGTVTADKATAKMGEKVTLIVTPVEGYVLSEITGVAVDENNTFTMPDSDVIINAVFTLKSYNVTISEATNGSVTADKATAKMGEKVTLTVTPAKGYELSEITGVEVAEDNTFTMPANDVTINAVFTKIEKPITEVSIVEGTPTADGKKTVNYSVPSGMDYVLVYATYNVDGSVKNTVVIRGIEDTNNGVLTVENNSKVMLWGSLENLEPLCEAFEVK